MGKGKLERRRGVYYVTDTTEQLMLPTGPCFDPDFPEHVWSPMDWPEPICCVHPGCRMPYTTFTIHKIADLRTACNIYRALVQRSRTMPELRHKLREAGQDGEGPETLREVTVAKSADTGECPLGRCTCDPWTPGRIVDCCTCRCHKPTRH